MKGRTEVKGDVNTPPVQRMLPDTDMPGDACLGSKVRGLALDFRDQG